MAQALRDSITEDQSLAQVTQWYETTIGQLEKVQGKAAALKESQGALGGPPTELLELLHEYQALAKDIFVSIEKIKAVVLVRVPEIKTEDNLGVEVQMTFLRQLGAVQDKLSGSGGGEKEGGGGALVAGLFFLDKFLEDRCEIEAKAMGTPASPAKETSARQPPASSKLRLKQVDQDAALKVQLATMQLATLLRGFVNSYALNFKKLIMPRENNNKMVS